jgi:2-polyprenyl-6-hydroxyphenyl methylase/3-demethylubiquinone-9 3-methyltransferase
MTVTSATRPSTIVRSEAAHFGKLAAEWWDPKGTSAMLHRLNPVRLGYIRRAVDSHWGGNPAGFAPLAGKRALDVGCGAGLLAEPLARLGAAVTGLDAAPENAAVAQAHADAGGLAIDYRAGSVEDLGDETFDLVTCLEVIEHVGDRNAFVRGLAGAVAPGGLLILSTPNRTALSRVALVGAAEATGMIPRGTHDWDRFLTPDDLGVLFASEGLRIVDTTGIVFSPATGFALGSSLALDYIVTAVPG